MIHQETLLFFKCDSYQVAPFYYTCNYEHHPKSRPSNENGLRSAVVRVLTYRHLCCFYNTCVITTAILAILPRRTSFMSTAVPNQIAFYNAFSNSTNHTIVYNELPTINETYNGSDWANFTNSTDGEYEVKRPVIGIVLSLFTVVTIFGNVLVIIAVFKEMYLRTVTNYFIVSLALADLMVGGIVMPFSISLEVTNGVWLYGEEWCDLWHSFDVLASTASILNLCVISLDRYWAITDPIAYTAKMSMCKVGLLIAFVWLCSAGISFPAIAWWKAVTPSNLPSHVCMFTEDSAYLIFSSIVSFYCPTFIMMFVYLRIYLAAAAQIRSLKVGSKVLTSNGSHGNREIMTLRMHRGGMNSPRNGHEEHYRRATHEDYSQSCDRCMDNDSTALTTQDSKLHLPHTHATNGAHHHRPAKFITKRLRQFALSKKLTKLAREQKAAKTLGIVVGVFIICWLPFFVFNVLQGICGMGCLVYPELLFPVFTWLGYINSGMNPVIYALSMRDFRRAFGKVLFCCCPKQRFSYQRAHQKYTTSTSSFTVSCADRV
ncbi:dopamine receptor 2-like [Pecten maximus]|uniref:dopamine receptor 2-like n=1 Tax=Pecten maximus TaxID=6579 RepID=UPI0014583BE2|nr:dopamine receptor 2-like [Pecten maximus]XP_033757325.1 dopamine receptor 2-like [Pecten maximus]